jgi:hypothetical protein
MTFQDFFRAITFGGMPSQSAGGRPGWTPEEVEREAPRIASGTYTGGSSHAKRTQSMIAARRGEGGDEAGAAKLAALYMKRPLGAIPEYTGKPPGDPKETSLDIALRVMRERVEQARLEEIERRRRLLEEDPDNLNPYGSPGGPYIRQ